jgi:hypothetical protein
VEKPLGILKGANLRAVKNAAGQIKSMQGDEAIPSKRIKIASFIMTWNGYH